MDLREAEQLAIRLMSKYHLDDYGWKFVWDVKPRNRWGQARYGRREIGLSVIPSRARSVAEVEDTIRHEIAHALVWIWTGVDHDHDKVWKKMAVQVGANPKATASTSAAIRTKYEATCKNCGEPYRRSKMTEAATRGIACSTCCKRHNGGRYSDQFRLDFIQNW